MYTLFFNIPDLNRRVLELETQLAETVNELEKTRNLLFMQYKINRDYKLEARKINDTNTVFHFNCNFFCFIG